MAWDDVLEVALAESLAGALWVGIRALPDGVVPVEVARAARAEHRMALAGNVLLRPQLLTALGALAAAGIDALPLKGGLYLLDGTLADPGARVMGDLDVAVGPAAFDAALDVLAALGYTPQPGRPFEHPHELPLLVDGGAPLELHASLGSAPIPAAVPFDAALARAERRERDGVPWLRLAADDVVVHHVLHTQVQDRNHLVFGLSLRQLHTAALVLAARGGDVDWASVRQRFDTLGLGPVLDGWLDQARRVAHLDVPAPQRRVRWRTGLTLASAAVGGWPSDLARNLAFALGADYLDSLYHHGGRPARLALARARHLTRLARRDGRGAMARALAPRR